MTESSAYIVDFEPIAFHVFGYGIHWYGIMYLIGFVGGWWLGRVRAKRPESGWTASQVDDLLFYVGLGVILGGRVGYILFYDLGNVLIQPTFLDGLVRIIDIRQGGMSFHGGLIGVLIALWFFSRHFNKRYFDAVDFLAVLAPIGLGVGRIGNFINGELWGKPTEQSWGMIFEKAPQAVPRHPTPLYEAFLEGAVLFVILWWFTQKPRPTMAASGLFAVGYSVFRIFVEFWRIPDAHLGYLAFDWVTMGQILSLPLLFVGVVLLWLAYRPGLKS